MVGRLARSTYFYCFSALTLLVATTASAAEYSDAMTAAQLAASPTNPTPNSPPHYSLESLFGNSASAPAPGSFAAAVMNGTPWIDARYRYENVDQDGLHEDAHASTLRTRLGYETGAFDGFRAGFELQNLRDIGAEHFNDGINGQTRFPTVPDPEDTSVNQAYLAYQGVPGTDIKIGRQYINLDNQRFVGTVDWRQLGQTFDAASIYNTYWNHTTLFYAYVRQINRVFGDDSTVGKFIGNTHLMNASYEFAPALKLTGYTYLLDFQSATPSINTLSTATYGLRFTGKYPVTDALRLSYTLEGAHQNSYADNPAGISESYYLIEPVASAYNLTGKLGYEMMQGNGTNAFQTPLATFHAFDGWADKFLTTPVNGLLDRYVSLSYKIPFGGEYQLQGTEITAVYHDWTSDQNDLQYGREWDGLISHTFFDHYTLAAELADYRAGQLFTNTTKVMAWLQIKY